MGSFGEQNELNNTTPVQRTNTNMIPSVSMYWKDFVI